jgi:uncharacterized protein YbjT (DUF2867 family)
MILVTGATGKIGSQVVKQLAEAGVPVRALVRDPQKAGDLAGPNVELVQGDLMDPASLDRAMQGVDKLFLLSPQGGDPLTMERAAVEAAQRAGVKHIVKLAVMGTSPFSHVGFLRSHWQVEKLIEQAGIDYTFLHPNHLMQHFIAVFAGPIIGTNSFFAPMKQGKVSMVDTRDIAAVAVAALTEEGHGGRVYDITGPEALSYSEAADKLSSALGRRIMYIDVPPEAAKQAIMGSGAPEFIADDVVGLYVYFSNGYGETTTDTVARVAKKQPTSFDQFARDFAPAWPAAG